MDQWIDADDWTAPPIESLSSDNRKRGIKKQRRKRRKDERKDEKRRKEFLEEARKELNKELVTLTVLCSTLYVKYVRRMDV